MGQSVRHHRAIGRALPPRCPLCRDTGLACTSCNRDCGSHPLPCSCQDQRLFGEQEWAALRVELLLGVPIAGLAGTLLCLFH